VRELAEHPVEVVAGPPGAGGVVQEELGDREVVVGHREVLGEGDEVVEGVVAVRRVVVEEQLRGAVPVGDGERRLATRVAEVGDSS
jgi:hypothetical protein